MKPDFEKQLLLLSQQLELAAGIVAESWKDATKERFYNEYIESFHHTVEKVISGKYGTETVYQRGLHDLLETIEGYIATMENMSGEKSKIHVESVFVDNYAHQLPNSGYDEYGRIKGWDNKYSGNQPGELTPEDIIEIMRQRGRNFQYDS